MQKLLDDTESTQFLEGLKNSGINIGGVSKDTLTLRDKLIEKNQEIIDTADSLLIDKLKNRDKSLRNSEIISLKAESFKQNQLLRGQATENIAIKVEDIQGKPIEDLQRLLLELD